MAGDLSGGEYYENPVLCRDGTMRMIAWHNNYITDDTGHNIGTLSSGQDITERKRKEQDLRELSVHLQNVREEEKASIAREVHDELGSTVAAIKMDAYWLSRKLAQMKGTELLRERAKSMVEMLDTVVKASRRIITNLHPTVLDEIGLSATVEWYCADFQKRTGIECKVVCAEDGDWEAGLGKTLSINLFRILQEALTNVVRHSCASRVIVELSHVGEAIILSVNDNGGGLPEGHTIAPTSYGMRGMRERIGLLGGKIGFDSPTGGGLCVMVELSLSDNNKGSEQHFE
jgi:signal transduction histidine kinase